MTSKKTQKERNQQVVRFAAQGSQFATDSNVNSALTDVKGRQAINNFSGLFVRHVC